MVLFSRAMRQECSTIVDIINQYERASGQKVNIEKSEVSFSKNVSREQRLELANLLGMKLVDKHDKYLGAPTFVGRSKKEIFAVIKERVWKKLDGWKEKFLSRAGKGVLIKAVIQAIPTYITSILKLPNSLIEEINSMCAKFWWGTRNGKRRLHWKSWDSLCKPKCMGGLGFRKLGVFNEAQLAKQGWRLIHNENTLLYKVYEAKYFKGKDYLNSSLGYSLSYAWKGIWAAKALLKSGLYWRVGNGNRINIWEDPWLFDEHGKKAITAPPVDTQLRMVSELINHDDGTWNIDLIESVFEERDKNIILSIPLSNRDHKDLLAWCFDNKGMFSVKSAYMIGAGINLDEFEPFWPKIWDANIAPKAKDFWWKWCSNILPTKVTLQMRHIAPNDACPRCNSSQEDGTHAIFRCRETSEAWMEVGVDAEQALENFTSPGDLIVQWSEQLDPRTLQIRMVLAWMVWTARNEHVFNSKSTPGRILGRRAQQAVDEMNRMQQMEARCKVYTSCNSLRYWEPPEENVSKFNFDATTDSNGWVSLGVVGRIEKEN